LFEQRKKGIFHPRQTVALSKFFESGRSVSFRKAKGSEAALTFAVA
jgi:hypothetical protein